MTPANTSTICYCNLHTFTEFQLATSHRNVIEKGPHDALSQLKSCQLLYNCPKIPYKNTCTMQMTMNFTGGQQNFHSSMVK